MSFSGATGFSLGKRQNGYSTTIDADVPRVMQILVCPFCKLHISLHTHTHSLEMVNAMLGWIYVDSFDSVVRLRIIREPDVGLDWRRFV
jgi:hypothetical protein